MSVDGASAAATNSYPELPGERYHIRVPKVSLKGLSASDRAQVESKLADGRNSAIQQEVQAKEQLQQQLNQMMSQMTQQDSQASSEEGKSESAAD